MKKGFVICPDDMKGIEGELERELLLIISI